MTAAGTGWAGYARRGNIPWPREHGTARGYFQHVNRGEYPCDGCKAGRAVDRRPAPCRVEYDRLRAAGVNAVTAAVLTLPRFMLARPAATGRTEGED